MAYDPDPDQPARRLAHAVQERLTWQDR